MRQQLPAQLIDRLRVRGTSRTALSLRLALSGALAMVDLRPSGLSPAAILIVRRLSAPLPASPTRAARTERQSRSLLRQPDDAWGRAARATLGDLARHAQRPALGPVPASAEAVLFDDEAELLACLARDLATGRATAWWWRAVLRGLAPDMNGLVVLLISHAQTIPAVLALLESWGATELILAELTAQSIQSLFTALCRAYAAPGLLSAITPNNAIPATELPGDAEPTPVAPWNPLLPAEASLRVVARLGHAACCLRGVALALHYAPAHARSAGFAERLTDWWQANQSHGSPPPTEAQLFLARSAGLQQRQPDPEGTEVASEAMQYANPTHTRKADDSLRDASDPAFAQAHRLSPAKQAEVPSAQISATDYPLLGNAGEPSMPMPAVDERQIAQPTIPQTAQAPDLAARTIGIPTTIGGLFYLIHLLAQLELPDCYETEWGLSSIVGAWGVLEALGRGLLARHPASLAADLLWPALASLAGRTTTEPLGVGLDCGPATLPPSWAAYADDHGSKPVDVFLPQGPLLAPLTPALVAWLALVLPSVRRCLLTLLGAPRSSDNGDDPIATLLMQPAMVVISRTHVDIMMSLDAIHLPARLAGLDRDPGWVPDLGRVVRFYFD